MKKNGKKYILIGLVLLFFLVVIALVFFWFHHPKTIFMKQIQKMSNQIFEVVSKNDNSLPLFAVDNKIELISSSTITFDDSFGMDPLQVAFRYQKDSKENKQLLDLNLLHQDQNLIGFNTYLSDNRIYYQIKEVMDKYYYIDGVLEEVDQIDIEELEYLVDLILDKINDNLSSDLFEQGKETITLNEENIVTNKITFKAKGAFINRVVEDSITRIKKDEKALDILTKGSGMSEEEVKEQLDTTLSEIDSTLEDEVLFTYQMYLKKNQVISQVIKSNEQTLGIDTYNKTTTIRYSSYDTDTFHFSLKQISDSNYQFTGSFAGMYFASGVYEKKDDTSTVSFTLKTTDNQELCHINITSVMKEVTKEQKYQNDISLNVDVQGLYFQITSQNQYQIISKLDEVDIANSVDYETISEEQRQMIEEKMMNLPLFQYFYELFLEQPEGIL